MDLGLADFINGFCGAVATYLAFQMKTIIANHEHRISALESRTPAAKPKAPRKKKPAPKGRWH
jgi:hypothetical protein